MKKKKIQEFFFEFFKKNFLKFFFRFLFFRTKFSSQNSRYQLTLPEEIGDDGLLSSLQLEAIVYACQQHEQFLGEPDDGPAFRAGYLIGKSCSSCSCFRFANNCFSFCCHLQVTTLILQGMELEWERDAPLPGLFMKIGCRAGRRPSGSVCRMISNTMVGIYSLLWY